MIIGNICFCEDHTGKDKDTENCLKCMIAEVYPKLNYMNHPWDRKVCEILTKMAERLERLEGEHARNEQEKTTH